MIDWILQRTRLAAAAVAVWLLCAPLVAAPDGAAVCNIETTGRIVAVGDVHGAYDRFVAILRAAGIIDRRDRWAGGDAILVQTGDVLDRGPESRKVLDLLQRLERDAPRAGGRVIALLGNHEVMVMVGDHRYVSPGEYAAFQSRDSERIRDRYFRVLLEDVSERAKAAGQEVDEDLFRERFLAQTPLGFVELAGAFGPAGPYGRWLRQHDTVARINGVLFLHGGIAPEVAARGCAAINDTVRAELADSTPLSQELAAARLSTSESGPLWFRGLALEPEDSYADQLDTTLAALSARAIVVGHTVTSDTRVTTRFGGRVIQIDTGMLDAEFFPGGRASALEIHKGRFTAIYETGREDLGVTLGTVPAAPPVPVR